MTTCHAHAKVQQAFSYALFINIAFTLFEFAAAWFSNSVSLLGDASHNLVDVMGLLLAWYANWLSARTAEAHYTYGYKRSTILSAFFNALLLILTTLFLAYEAIHHWIQPQPIQTPVVIVVSLLGVIVNVATALLFSNHHHDLNQRGAYLHLMMDALVSLAVALSAVAIILTGWMWLDAVLGLLICGVLLWGIRDFLLDTIRSLLDGVPVQLDKQQILACLLEETGALSVHELHIWSIGTQDIALTAHLVVAESSPRLDYSAIRQTLLQRYGIGYVTLQTENMACAQAREIVN